ncbi:TetR/AcrR family transcriptional regulator [Vibrio sinensis]|uniref:TetR/AcrR family transcriptional regulator n=1 Tax=Vibrio sinensis TaxID=2302434 RepID=A0A3A6QL10_9VIBR|nr:TetR/AcrR family transcriptional regulator [Vibrio sinensis]RJX66584.1 TetR/AcrR family transcriptional regulator [Vibrio sinensis]
MKVSERKHLALIEAAQQEFVEHGFSAANMDRVCEKAGTSKRTLYRHFDSKDGLFIAAMNDVLQQQRQKVTFSYTPNRELKIQLCEYLNAKLDALYQDCGLLLAKMVISEFLRTPEFAERYVAQLRSIDHQLEQWISDAIDDEKLNDCDPKVMSHMLNCLVQGHFFWPQLLTHQEMRSSVERQSTIDNILVLFLSGYERKS